MDGKLCRALRDLPKTAWILSVDAGVWGDLLKPEATFSLTAGEDSVEVVIQGGRWANVSLNDERTSSITHDVAWFGGITLPREPTGLASLASLQARDSVCGARTAGARGRVESCICVRSKSRPGRDKQTYPQCHPEATIAWWRREFRAP